MWLDVLAAKARCGMWLGGVLPRFNPWPAVFHARQAAAKRRRRGAARGGGGGGAGDAFDADADADGDDAAADAAGGAAEGGGVGSGGDGGSGDGGADEDEAVVRLQGLSHPLLLANYLRERERLQRELVLLGADRSVGAAGQQRPTQRRLPGRRAGAGDEDDEDENARRVAALRRELAALRPPRPLNLFIQAETSAVVITGPNTGGKTATMKALGLTALMAKAGMPVPAAAPAALPCFTSVLADIGDEQSLTANLSTFSGHLRR